MNRSVFLGVFISKLLSSSASFQGRVSCLLYLFPSSLSKKENQDVSVCFFLSVSASFLGDIKSHGWQYLTRGSHHGNIYVWDLGLCACVCMCMCVCMCCGVDTQGPVGETDRADTPMIRSLKRPSDIDDGSSWTGLHVPCSIPILDTVPRI